MNSVSLEKTNNQLLIESHQNSFTSSPISHSKLQEKIIQGNLAEYFSIIRTNTRILVATQLNIDTYNEPKGSENALP